MIQIKRVYDAPTQEDGYRILVDRLWPRGITRQQAAIDLWLKDIAPSPGLRIWFDHQAERYDKFSLEYIKELSKNPAAELLKDILIEHPRATLLYAAKDPTINHAAILKVFLETEHSRPDG